MQDQIVQLVKASDAQSQALVEILRQIGATTAHATASGIAAALPVLQEEFAAFITWDQTGDIPQVNGHAVAIANPKYQPELIDDYRIKMVDDGNGVQIPEIINNEQQYTVVKIRNAKFNANIAPYIFNSSSEIDLDAVGNIVGTDGKLETQLIRLQVAALLDAYLKSDPDDSGLTILERIEKATTI